MDLLAVITNFLQSIAYIINHILSNLSWSINNVISKSHHFDSILLLINLNLSNRPDLKALLENDVLVGLAKKYNKTTAQICLRWGIQRG